jgi:hypothetical protein
VTRPISRHPCPDGSPGSLKKESGFNLIVKWTLTPCIAKTSMDIDNGLDLQVQIFDLRTENERVRLPRWQWTFPRDPYTAAPEGYRACRTFS